MDEVESLRGFDLLSPVAREAAPSFHVLVGLLDIFSGSMFFHIICPLF